MVLIRRGARAQIETTSVTGTAGVSPAMSAKREQCATQEATPTHRGSAKNLFVAHDPRVPREARFTLGYFISRLQRFESTRSAQH
jgi:hypothetical protein